MDVTVTVDEAGLARAVKEAQSGQAGPAFLQSLVTKYFDEYTRRAQRALGDSLGAKFSEASAETQAAVMALLEGKP
jgi:hypothetical protein